MNRYESYKDSGIQWLGEVPEHWEIKRLRFTLNVNPVKSEIKLPINTLVSFIPMEAVNLDKNLTLTQEKFIDEVYKGYTYFRNDDVIVAKITPCFENGKSAIAQKLTNGIAFGTTELHVLRANLLINNQFLYYLIKSDLFMKIGESEMYGAGGQKRVPEEFIKNFSIGLPPLPEQTAIADYLDNKLGEIDALISKQETLLAKLAEQRTAMITHAVTKGLKAHAPMKNSGVAWLGDVPEHWRIIKLGHTLLNLRTGLNPRSNFELNTSDADNYYVTIQELVNDSIKFTDNTDKINDEALKIINNRSVLKIGDILLSGTGTIGKTALISETPKNWNIKEGVYALTPNLNSISSSFLLRLFHAKYILSQMDMLAMGSTVRSVKMADLKFIKIVLPPLPEQAAIAQYLDEQTANIDRLSDTVNQTIARLKEYRSALITQAVTGKIKVI